MSNHTDSKPRGRSRPLPHAVHTVGVEVGLAVGEYGTKKAAKYLSSRPYKMFPKTNVIRPQPFRWGVTRSLGRTGRLLGTKLGGKIPIVGPIIDLFTPSETIMSGSEEMRLLRETRARWAEIDRQGKQGIISKDTADRAKMPWLYKQKHISTGDQLRPRTPFSNIAGQIHVDLLKSQPLTRKSKSLPPLNRIKGLPKFKGGLVPEPKIGNMMKSKQMDRMRKYVPPLRPHKPSVPPPYKHVTSKPTSVRTGSRPFNWKSNAIPPKHLQSTFMPDRPGQPGWGLEVRRSRPTNSLRNMWQQGNRFSPLMSQPVQKRIPVPPMRPFQSNPLRQMSQGLMNPNRARPMMRPPMFR